MHRPRVAILGILLEANAFVPEITTEADFRRRAYLEGEEIMRDARSPAPVGPMEVPGFVDEMDRSSPWKPVPILVASAPPGGPADDAFFRRCIARVEDGLASAMPLDAVYITNHGAMTTTVDEDPDGQLYAAVRAQVGPDVPIAATVDLHCNLSQRMVDSVDVVIGYVTNPHVDMRERGAEAARALRQMMAGLKTSRAFIRLPIIPPTVTLLTAAGPYADLFALGRRLMADNILNITILGGFAYSDTSKNGLAVLVTARGSDPEPARRVAREIAEAAWADRARFHPKLTSLDDAIALVKEVCADEDRPPVILADVADNPGGGGGGNTTWLLSALRAAGARRVLLGVFIDARLAAAAHARGVGGRFDAVFNAERESAVAKRLEAPVTVVALHDGQFAGRRGLYGGTTVRLGPTALLDMDGIEVVVATWPKQCADPVFFEALGLDIGQARVVVVKSRGHFRAGFDEFFGPDQVIEVDCPGLVTPVLERLGLKNIPRPVVPLDEDVVWSPPFDAAPAPAPPPRSRSATDRPAGSGARRVGDRIEPP
jgi:microcystin degradation protein MlrC